MYSVYVAKFCGAWAPHYAGHDVPSVRQKIMALFCADDRWEKAERHGWSIVAVPLPSTRKESSDAG